MRLLSPPTEEEERKLPLLAPRSHLWGLVAWTLTEKETAEPCLICPLSLLLLTSEPPMWGSDRPSFSEDPKQLRNPNNAYPLSPQTMASHDQNCKVIFLTIRVNSCGSVTSYTKLSSDSCLWARTRLTVTETLDSKNAVVSMARHRWDTYIPAYLPWWGTTVLCPRTQEESGREKSRVPQNPVLIPGTRRWPGLQMSVILNTHQHPVAVF